MALTVALVALIVSFTILLLLGVPVAFAIALVVHPDVPRRRPAARDGLPEHDLGHERVLVPRDPVLHLLRRADAARRHRGQDRELCPRPRRALARRAGHGQRGRLHAVRRRIRLAGRRRVGDGRRDDSDDEARGLQCRLRRQRDDPCLAGRRADAHVPQHDHLRLRRTERRRNDRRHGDQGRIDRRPDVRGPAARGMPDHLHARRRVLGGGQERLPEERRRQGHRPPIPGLVCGAGVAGGGAAGTVRRDPDSRLHHQRCDDGNRGRRHRGGLFAAPDLRRVPHDELAAS